MRRLLPAVLSTVLATGFLLTAPQATAETTAEPAAPASTFTPLSPVRVMDTRNDTGGVRGTVDTGETITLNLAAHVPANATAVVLNVTGVDAMTPTYVTVFPAGLPRPNASNLNLSYADTRPNQVTVTLGTTRAVSLYNNYGSIHLVADLAGYYSTGSGAKFTPLPPKRTLDTRLSGGPVGAGGVRTVDLTGHIPASATAVTFNLTATNPTAATFVTAFPTGASRPDVSNLNVPTGETRPNLVTVAVGADRKVSLYNNAGSTDLLVDVTGFYTPEYGNHFIPFNPKRVLDTRNGSGALGPRGHHLLDLADELPLTATGVVMNLTGVDATASTYVTAWADVGEAPNASNLNLTPGQTVANAAVVAFSNDRIVAMVNNAGDVHLIADLAGVFAVVDPTPCTTDCVYTWGYNLDRRLGTGESVVGSSTPKKVVGLSNAREVTAGLTNGYALRQDGTVWSWGHNIWGQLGNGWSSEWHYGGSAVPTPVVNLSNIKAIAAGNDSAYALREDGTVWSWGYNHFGQLGTGTTNNSNVPVRVGTLTNIVAIAAGEQTAYALGADGTLYAWGYNGGGHLGNNTTTEYTPVPVVVPLPNITKIAAGGQSTYAQREDGTVWSWGHNFNGTLGTGQPCGPNDPCESRLPVQITALTEVTALESGYMNGRALQNGRVWSWGGNYSGELGNGTTCQGPTTCESRVPVPVSNLSNTKQVSSQANGAYALKTDGTVWTWGNDYHGSLANNNLQNNYSASPVKITPLTNVTTIGSGPSMGLAIAP
jgi:alpha-tubulin suppressor-like RCC1 family protein